MRKAVLIGTDFAYDSGGKLVPLEINTNVGWDDVNRKETVKEIFDFTELSMYVREHTIKELCLEGKIAEICKDLIQEAIPDVSVKVISKAELDAEYPDTTLVVRTAWSPVALVDTFAANKERFKKLIRNEDFSEDFKLPEGNLPNLVVKAIKPQYDKSEYPKFYKADVATLRVPDGYIVEPAVLNAEKLVEGRIPVFRNWSLFVTDGETIDSIYLGTYTKVCGEEFDENKLEYDASGALIRGRGMLVSLDDLSTKWPADALLEASDEVLMTDGSWKKASDLKVGDKVKSLDLGETDIRHTGNVEISVDSISNLSEASVDFLTRTRGYRDFVEITFKDKSTWFDTGKSAYMVKTGNQVSFVNIEDLKKGDVVYFLDVETSKIDTKTVKSVETVRKYVDTFNIGLEGNHVFYSRGAGETSAFASIEHNDTSDCITAPKSSAGAFQTFISIRGNNEVVSKPSSLTVSNKTFSSTTSAKGDFVNPDDYTTSKDGFTGCWYPLSATNATWTINVPTKTGDTEYCAAILRRGSTDGEALGESRGAEVYWKLVKCGSTAQLPVKFTVEDGPCEVYATVVKPSELVELSDVADELVDASGGNLPNREITYPLGRGIQGTVQGIVTTEADWVSLGISEFNSNDGSSATLDCSVDENTSFDSRSGKVRVLLHDGSVDALAVEYTISQAGKILTLLVNPTNIEVPAAGANNLNSEKITVSTNGTWSVTTANSWLTVGKGNGSSTTGDVTYTVAENTEFAQRTGTVTITATDGSQTKSGTITFVQAAKVPVLTVSPESIVFDEPQGDIRTVTVTSNTSWEAETFAMNEWFTKGATAGTGNGTIEVASDYPDTQYYTCDGSNVTLTPLTITTKVGVSGISEVVRTINMYCKAIKFVAPTLDMTAEAMLNDGGLASFACRETLERLWPGYWVCVDDGSSGTESCYLQIDPVYYIYFNGANGIDTGATGMPFTNCIPVEFSNYTGSGVTAIRVVGSSGLGDTPVGFAYVRQAEHMAYGMHMYATTASSLTLASEVTFAATSSMGLPENWDSFTYPTMSSDDALHFIVGTGSAQIEPGSTVDIELEYYDNCTGTTATLSKSYTFGYYPSFYITADSSFENPWEEGTTYGIPSTGSGYFISFSGLDRDAKYRLLVSDAIEHVYAGSHSTDFADGKAYLGSVFEDQESSVVVVSANTSSESRKVVVALVPENNGTVEDINNTDLFGECLDSGGSRNGRYYYYLCAVQEVSK